MKKKTDINELTKDLFVMIGEKQSLQYDRGKLIHKGRLLSDAEKGDIINQAKLLQTLSLVPILLEEMEAVACKKIYNEGGDDPELLKGGKWILYTIDVLRKKINNLAKLK